MPSITNIRERMVMKKTKTEKKDAIVGISVQEIYQHPDNPRKDLGDLSELAESIKKNGIMQNLTVIPGHWLTEEEWKEAGRKYQKEPSEELRALLNKKWTPEGYTLIIGHRRFASAKLAGLTELPCRVVEGMDKKDQVSTMLAENMQRADLTIWEQANGFQMMLDLGVSEEQIAEKSGFSRTTVRRRLNIAKLDQKLLKEKEAEDGFQLSLKDLYELEKVEDIAERNKILREAGNSRELIWKANSAATEAERKKRAGALIKMLEDRGIEKAPEKASQEIYTTKWVTVEKYSLDDDIPTKLGIPKKEKDKLYYLRYYNSVWVIKRAPEKQETSEEKKRKEIDAKKKQIKAVLKEMDRRKHEFIDGIISGKLPQVKETQEIREEMWKVLVEMETFLSMANMQRFFTGKCDYECSPREKEEARGKIERLDTFSQMMLAMSYRLENAGDVYDWQLHYNGKCCGEIKRAYAILERYGWTYTDEEKRILDGLHEFYVPEEKK